MPDAWLRGAPDADAKYTLKESVALAFVAPLQILSPPQRATLLLRDVVGMSAEETAAALGVSVSAANSALFRARGAVEAKIGDREAFAASARDVDVGVLERWVRAFESSDVETLVALLHDDVVTTMPPSPTWIAGRADNEAFYRAMSSRAPRGASRVVALRANGQPAFAFYRADPGGPHLLRAIHVAAVRDGRVARVDHFMMSEVFDAFGLPRELSAPSAG